MKKVLLSLAALSAIAVAVPAAAQPYGQYVGAYGYQNAGRDFSGQALNQRRVQLASRVDIAYRRGQISGAEANMLASELRRIEALDQRFRRNGRTFTNAERREIANRLDRVQAQLRIDRNDGARYGYGYGRW